MARWLHRLLHRLRDGRITAVGVREGLFDDLVVHILDDGQGMLWMSSNRGVFSVSKREVEELATGRITRVRSAGYGGADGMPSAVNVSFRNKLTCCFRAASTRASSAWRRA